MSNIFQNCNFVAFVTFNAKKSLPGLICFYVLECQSQKSRILIDLLAGY